MSSDARQRPRVKVCGVTEVGDARRSIELGAELVGLNFYPESPRYIAPDAAAELVAACGGGAASTLWVGVFVNEPVERAVAIADPQRRGRAAAARRHQLGGGVGGDVARAFRIEIQADE
ncbi:MAG: hypothetical protein AAFX50_04150, partial [Acidobacteriota bacterium]